MARHTGPRVRILRRLRASLPGLTRKTAERRPYPPGQHGPTARLRLSEFAKRLIEKQKLRFHYGLTETQLRNYVERATAARGPAGHTLLRLLERRLDNVVFRLGLAPTIPAARQLVVHGHIFVDGQRVSAPGYSLTPGQSVRLRTHAASSPTNGVPAPALPSFLERDPDGFGGRVLAEPERADAGLEVDPTLVIEFYAR